MDFFSVGYTHLNRFLLQKSGLDRIAVMSFSTLQQCRCHFMFAINVQKKDISYITSCECDHDVEKRSTDSLAFYFM